VGRRQAPLGDFLPLKDIGTDTDQSAIFEFLLVFHGNNGPTSYPFPDKGQYLHNFPTARIFNAPAQGVPLGIL